MKLMAVFGVCQELNNKCTYHLDSQSHQPEKKVKEVVRLIATVNRFVHKLYSLHEKA